LPRELPVFLVVNKSDRLAQPKRMLSFLERASKSFDYAAVVPVSASKGRNLGELRKALASYLPEQPPLFDADAMTDQNERFLAAELVREKVFRLLGEELPYVSTVTIDRFEQRGRLKRIHTSVIVEKESHKAIVIGARGEKLKAIASAARRDMEALFGGKVFLEVWVKVRKGWTDNAVALRRLGLEHG
jgi:GTP-binding protein Era